MTSKIITFFLKIYIIYLFQPGAPDLDPLGNGKRSIALNLKSQKGINIFKKLTNECDVLIDPYRKGKSIIYLKTKFSLNLQEKKKFSYKNNFFQGVMEKLKLGPSDLMAENKKLIYARLTGFGQTGPYSTMAGHDINFLSLSGKTEKTL